MLNKEKFNSNTIGSQICLMNDYISQFGSLREACRKIGIAKSTIQSRFKKAGYVFENNKYVIYAKSGNHEALYNSLVVEHEGMVENDLQTSAKISSFDTKKYLKPVDHSNVIKNSDLNIDDIRSKFHLLNSIEDSIRFNINSIATSFVRIGFYLKDVKEKELYVVKGFSSVFEYANEIFNIKQRTVYGLIDIANRFGNVHEFVLKDEYKDFSYSQLVEMLSLPLELHSDIKPTDTVKEIREKKKVLKEKEINEDGEVLPGPSPVLNSVDDDITVMLKRSEIVDLLFVVGENSNFTTSVIDKLRKAIGE